MVKFCVNEEGAVTVDWVVLAAALIVLAGTVITVVGEGLTQGSTTIETRIKAKAADPLGK
ncbi:MAG: hypothetical protein AAGJ34_10750 [Pseudomonadota bacterium]